MTSAFRVALIFIACASLSVAEEEITRAFTGAKIFPITGDPIDSGTLIVRGSTIIAVGKDEATEIPEGAVTVDVSGKVMMPGLICTHSHIGQVSGGDSSAPIQPDVRVLDSINVRDASVRKARAGGLTTVNIMSGSGHLLSGQTIYLKLRKGETVEDLMILDTGGKPRGGMKMANGTNSIKTAPFPGTRGKSAALVREQYIKAQAYQKKLAAAKEDPDKAPERDLAMEALVEVLEGKRVVHHHTHRHDDILTVLRLREEFGFRLVLHHVSEAWKVAPQIAAAKVPCSIILLDSPGGKLEARDIEWRNGAELEKLGVVTSFHTDDPINDSRWFLRSGGFAVRAGMSRHGALYALTMAGAIQLDMEERVGSLSAGKDADFIILSGDPLSVYSRVEETWIEGKRVFNLADPEDKLFAVGGEGAGSPRLTNMCCFDFPIK
ncbi:amidohydrolase family protein [Verrucomicrobiales bacterium]|jgi:imidazolonepropionase-like amidohydrolase|nr:amidohydrolase family protein [Verrucomicrobiales bacterium]MDC0502767.1 amidohydrolase family protein [Verrucomicrobiales bacterium]MDF1787929.1 amidohydrolase family protein [Verrucomicrobiales bacterium]